MSEDGSPLGMQEFTFSFSESEEALKDIELRRNAVEARIKRLSDKVTIKGVPLVDKILELTTDQEELEILGKILTRISQIIPEYVELEKKYEIAKATVEHPEWIASMFADFSGSCPDTAENFLGTFDQKDNL